MCRIRKLLGINLRIDSNQFRTYIITVVRSALGHRRNFGLIQPQQVRNEMILLRLITRSSLHVATARTLAGQHVAMIVQRTARIAVTQRTTVLTLRQSIRFGHTLITIFAGHQSLARTFARMHVATGIINRSQCVARTALATVDTKRIQIPEAFFTCVTPTTAYIWLTMTRARFDAILLVIDRITNAIVQRSGRIAIACYNRDLNINI